MNIGTKSSPSKTKKVIQDAKTPITKISLSKQSNEDDIEKVVLQHEPGPLINEDDRQNKSKEHPDNVNKKENSNAVEKEHKITENTTNNILSQTPGKVLQPSQESESESTSSEDEESSICSMSSGTRFHFYLDGRIENENIVLGVHSSFEKHPIRVNQLSEFKIKQEEGFQYNKHHFERLILCSKKVSSERLKKHVEYEGMYGFVSKHQHDWILEKELNVNKHRKAPYIWQNLITTSMGEYSQEKSLNYFKGIQQDSQVLIDTCTIAWDYLQSFLDNENHEERWFDDIKTFIDDNYSFLEEGSLNIDYDSKSKNHKLIGDTPFTSCHVIYWKEQQKSIEIIISYEDVCACVLMCFGTSDCEDGKLTFQLQKGDDWSKPAYLMSDTIFLFSPNKSKFKIQGIPSSRLLLLFYIDESTVEKIQKTDRKSRKPVNDWYSLFSNEAKKEQNAHSTKTNQTTSKPKKRNNRKRTGAKYSSRSVRSGYIDLEVSHKQEGTKRSCLQDAFINAAFLFEKDIKEQMYKLFPPMEKKNASLSKIMNSPVITENFHLESEKFQTKLLGGNEWRLLHHLQGTGVYIVWGTVTPMNRRTESHSFVYNSCFTNFNGKKYYGAIIDNRVHSKLRAFSEEDLKDHLTARKSLSDYFGGVTRVHNWIRICDKNKL